MKHLNSDLKPLAEGLFPDRGPHLFGEDCGGRAKATADNVKALKGIQSRKRFFASSDSKYKSQSRRQQWGASQPSQKSVLKRLGPSQTLTTGAHHFKKPHFAETLFYSSLFLVPKKSGQMRPVINLRPLNQFLRYQHFKMEGIHVVKDLLRQGDWLTRINLKDVYFSIPST